MSQTDRADQANRAAGAAQAAGAGAGAAGAEALPGGRERVALDGLAGWRRSHGCGQVSAAQIGEPVVVCGWVHARRDHGGLIFVDLRDRTGLLQVVLRSDESQAAHARGEQLRSEFVMAARGPVRRRDPGDVNPSVPNGDIEVAAQELRVLNSALPPPFPIEEQSEVDEQVRLRRRVHDLRRPPLQRALEVRHRLLQSFRRALSDEGFLEIETPMLAKATPEGARDFLVPSRLQPGAFYALPQSPQLMKQLLMISGFDRYFQIARCFRDEDQRADRQLEFSQVDLEMSFVGVDEVLALLEMLTARTCSEACGVELPRPFPRLSYGEAMSRYGSDRPDTRIELELLDFTELFAHSEFRAFRSAVEAGGAVKCLPVPAADSITRGDVDRLTAFVQSELSAAGLAWVRIAADGAWQSPIAKFLSEQERAAMSQAAATLGAGPGALLLFQAGPAARVNAVLARLRSDLGQRLGRVQQREWDPLLLTGFPLFERGEDGALTYVHMPFVAPMEEDIPLLHEGGDPLRIRSTHYDVVLNGVELGSGSLRNHRSDVQRRILAILGYGKSEMEARFGFLLNALESGAPPHGGFAYGFDRIVMLMAGADNLRDVIAFPKTQRGQDLLMGAPSEAAAAQLSELGLQLPAPPPADPADGA